MQQTNRKTNNKHHKNKQSTRRSDPFKSLQRCSHFFTHEIWGKVMFLHLSVILFTGWEGGLPDRTPWTETLHPLDRDSPLGRDPPQDRDHPSRTETPPDRAPPTVKNGRYASYWNAFLLPFEFTPISVSFLL